MIKFNLSRGLIRGSEHGALMREGLGVVILGAPNVGKSTLLNCFAKENLAIVSDTPGTTRDLISANINLGRSACRVCGHGRSAFGFARFHRNRRDE